MRARYYEPGTGRFVSEDPGFDGRNWYSYCQGDPIKYVDNSGKLRIKPGWGDSFDLALATAFVLTMGATFEVERNRRKEGIALTTLACVVAAVSLGAMTDMGTLQQVVMGMPGIISALAGALAAYNVISKTVAGGIAGGAVLFEMVLIIGALASIDEPYDGWGN